MEVEGFDHGLGLVEVAHEGFAILLRTEHKLFTALVFLGKGQDLTFCSRLRYFNKVFCMGENVVEVLARLFDGVKLDRLGELDRPCNLRFVHWSVPNARCG